MARGLCGVGTVERVDAERDALLKRWEIADAEQVIGFIGWQVRHRGREHFDHFGNGFSHAATDGKAIEGFFREGFDAVAAQEFVDTAMDHSIHRLAVWMLEVSIERSHLPAVGPLQGIF